MAGLGCGHKIAPVLARLEATKIDAKVEVDRSGTLVRVSPAERVEDVRATLAGSGIRSETLDRTAAAQSVAETTDWYSRANIRALSKEEFQILARRWTRP